MINHLEIIYDDHIDELYLSLNNGLLIGDFDLYYKIYHYLQTFNNSVKLRFNGTVLDKNNFIFLDLSHPLAITKNLSQTTSSIYYQAIMHYLKQQLDVLDLETLLCNYFQSNHIDGEIKQFNFNKFIELCLDINFGLTDKQKLDLIINYAISENKIVFLLTNDYISNNQNIISFTHKIQNCNVFVDYNQVFSYDLDSLITIYEQENLTNIDRNLMRDRLLNTYFMK